MEVINAMRNNNTQRHRTIIRSSIPFSRNKKIIFSSLAYVLFLLFSYIILITFPPNSRGIGYAPPLLPPSLQHPLGTDTLGREILVLLGDAILNSSKIGLIAATIGTLAGSIIGFLSGYYGGKTDYVLRLFTDVFLAVPSLLFLVLISSLVRTVSVEGMGLLIALFSWSWPARQVRAQALSLKERDFIYLSALSGESKIEIIFREMMPHMIPWMTANFVNAFISAILTEAGLSILGLGPQTEMTLGILLWWPLNNAAIYRGLWWWWAPPVLALLYLFFTLYMLQLGITEIINPRSKVV
jgi:peptide/nickel transport system permease protein